MGRYTRAELDEAFEHYKQVSAEAASSGDWGPWADLFTDDVHYVEHLFGEMRGRDEVARWITRTMATPPNDLMRSFPVDWHIVDEDRGWVVFCAQNRMDDPGDGQVYEAPSWSLLKYAGDNKWSYEEDIYSPDEFGRMIAAWSRVSGR
jgi:hypothetical protein